MPTLGVATLFVVGLALRPQIVGVGPLLPRIESSLHVSHAVAGLLATIPVLCMGLFAPLAPPVLRRLGSRGAVAAALAVAAVVGAIRAGAPQIAVLLALTVPLGIGIAVAGTLLPVIVKEDISERPTFGTGVYTAGINVGATLAAVAAAPLAALASWRLALLVFSVATVPVIPLWLRREHRIAHPVERTPLPFRRPVAWLLVAVFGLQSSLFYGFNAWLPEAYVDRGWSSAAAGGLVALLNGAGLVAGIATALAGDRAGSRRMYVGGAAIVATAAAALIAADVPGAWAWAGALGLALGVLFTTSMTLPLDVADAPASVAAATTLMLGAGYAFSALAPLALGALRDRTGTFTASLGVLAGVGAVLLALAAVLSPRRLHPL